MIYPYVYHVAKNKRKNFISKIVLITGATDGIGLIASRKILKKGHTVLIHGRNATKVKRIVDNLSYFGKVDGFTADLSDVNSTQIFSAKIIQKYRRLDVLINNAGVLKNHQVVTKDGLDICFAVNTISPFLLANQLLPLLSKRGRVVNVASAAQASVDIDALIGKYTDLSDMEAYSQSKLAMIMWSSAMAKYIDQSKTVFVSVNPGSLLGTKMVRDYFGISGKDVNIGANILVQLAVDEKIMVLSGKYFDNDKGFFTSPHPDALDEKKCFRIIKSIKSIL